MNRIAASVTFKKIRKVLELDSKIFKPCSIKVISRGIMKKSYYFVHYDGKQWDILIVEDRHIKTLPFYVIDDGKKLIVVLSVELRKRAYR